MEVWIEAGIMLAIGIGLYIRDRRRKNWIRKLIDVKAPHFNTGKELHNISNIGLTLMLKNGKKT